LSASRVKVGIIGLGNICDFHIPALQALVHRAEISVVCCRTEERGNQKAKELGAIYVADYKDTFDKADALIVATPHHLHFPMVRDALTAGVKHILVEKPAALTVVECDELIDLAEENGASVTVGYVLRHAPAIQKMKQLLDEGRYGPAIAALCRTEHGFDPEEFVEFLPSARKIETIGGGVLFSHGCHYVDLLIWLLGDVTGAQCVRNHTLLKEVMEGEDSAIANFTFDSGAVASYFATWAVRYRELAIDLRVYCLEGQIVFQQLEDASTALYTIDKDGRHDLHSELDPAADGPTDGFITVGLFQRQAEAWLDTIQSGKPTSVSLREGKKSIAAIRQAEAS